MRILYQVIMIYIGLFLSGCASLNTLNPPAPEPAKTPTPLTKPAIKACPFKDPMTVTFYTVKQQLKKPYRVIGKATISKFNLGGVKKQEAIIHDAMRNLAASLGGDAVINITHDAKTITGIVVAYDNTQPQALAF
jgi:hypothetical protein